MKILGYIIGGFFLIGIIGNMFEGESHQDDQKPPKQETLTNKKGSGIISNNSNRNANNQAEDIKVPLEVMLYSLKKETKCVFNGGEYILPQNAHCTNSKTEAWECNEGFKEIGHTCQKIYRDGNGNCNVKGNISFKSKEKKYHLPGSKYYDETNIDPKYGERYFCTEQDAINAGWRIATTSEKADNLEYVLSTQSKGDNYNGSNYEDDTYYEEENYPVEQNEAEYDDTYSEPCYRFDC